MSWWDRMMLKTYLKLHFQSAPPIYPGVFRITTGLTYSDFIKTIAVAPKPITLKLTFLE
jgi:hypothetical protein